jgi:hypothetical protein
VKRKSMMFLIVFILALTLCNTVVTVNTSYGINVANSGLFETVLTAIAFIGIGAAYGKSGKFHGDSNFNFDNDYSSWDDAFLMDLIVVTKIANRRL